MTELSVTLHHCKWLGVGLHGICFGAELWGPAAIAQLACHGDLEDKTQGKRWISSALYLLEKLYSIGEYDVI
jgi:hypothetical protein